MIIDESDESMNARISKAQREDNDLIKIFLLADKQQYENFVVRRGLLFKEVNGDIRLVVLKSMQNQIIRRIHERGHFSAEKTEILLKKDYWFPKMHQKSYPKLRCLYSSREKTR